MTGRRAENHAIDRLNPWFFRVSNCAAFETCVEKVRIPELRPGDVVVMDNLSSHEGPGVRELIEAAGAELMFLPPYSPDFNPIENAFVKMKAPRCQVRTAVRKSTTVAA